MPVASSPETLLSYLGDASELLNSVWPSNQVPDNQDEQQKLLTTFTKMYRAHYDKFIKALSTLNFQDVENIWAAFWQQSDRSEETGASSVLDLSPSGRFLLMFHFIIFEQMN